MKSTDWWPNGIQGLASRLKNREISCSELARFCLGKIDTENPSLKAWAYVDATRVLDEARELDRLLESGLYLGRLHGVPLGVKDIFDVRGMPTSAGYPPLAGSTARQDCAVVADLRAQGALILGKTATCAFASFDPAPTLNPLFPDRTPGGSSAGSASAVAAGHCPAAIGSQTGGSILRPAAYCGVVGFKPTHGAIPVSGVFPLAPTLDHVGFITTRPECAEILNAATSRIRPGQMPDFRTVVFWKDVEENIYPTVPGFSNLFRNFLDRGWKCREEFSPPELLQWLEAHKKLMAWEALRFHRDFEKGWETKYPPGITSLMRSVVCLDGPEVQALYEMRRQARRKWAEKMGPGELLCLPVAEKEVPGRERTGDYRFCGIASFLGLPAVGIPISPYPPGSYSGAYQLVGPMGSDHLLLRVANGMV